MIIAWFHWWWDSEGLDRAQVVLGVLGLLATIALGFVGWWLAKRQVEIGERQMLLAEKQDRLLEKHASRRSLLELQLASSSHAYSFHETSGDFSAYRIEICNSGTKAADDAVWYISQPNSSVFPTGMRAESHVSPGSTELPAKEGFFPEDTPTFFHVGHFTRPLFAGQRMPCVEIRLFYLRAAIKLSHIYHVDVAWYVESDDGRCPPQRYGIIKLPLYDEAGWFGMPEDNP